MKAVLLHLMLIWALKKANSMAKPIHVFRDFTGTWHVEVFRWMDTNQPSIVTRFSTFRDAIIFMDCLPHVDDSWRLDQYHQ